MATRHGPLLRLAVIGVLGSMAVTGCVSGGESPKTPSSKPSPPPGQGTPPPTTGQAIQTKVFNDAHATLKMDILSLARLNNSILKLRYRIASLNASDTLTNTFGDNSFDNITLIDGAGMKAYFPLGSKQGYMMQAGLDNATPLEEGTPITASVFYPSPPTSVTKVDVNMPVGPPFTDIPIQGTTTVQGNEPDPTKVPLLKPRIEDLLSPIDDLSGDKSIDESGKGQDIRLNTDVLFALNKAKLSGKAEGILKDVAERIDKASASTIKIDSYTDNSGNDAINDPLSRRRAEAVANKLKDLVTRSGVTYQTAGHGSSDPVASNKTSEGRQKNRRVTVTIAK